MTAIYSNSSREGQKWSLSHLNQLIGPTIMVLSMESYFNHYLHFFFLQNPSLQQMFKSGEPLFNRQAYQSEDQNESQIEVSHDGSSHQPASLILAMDASGDPQRGRVRPGDAFKLVPPPCDDQAHVEPQNKGDWDLVGIIGTIEAKVFEINLGCKQNKKYEINSFKIVCLSKESMLWNKLQLSLRK